MLVDNRPGAGGTVGSNLVATAPADGHTLLMGTVGTLAVSPGLYRNLPYDTDRDLTPVALVSAGNFALAVSTGLTAASFQDFVRLAKSKPNELNYGSAGNGSMPHLGMELLASAAGLRLTHVPYKSSGQLVAALMSGEVHAGLPDVPAALQQFRAGRLRIVAVAGPARDALLPDVPTIAESGLSNFDIGSWLGIMAPSRTPAPIISQLNDVIVKSLQSADVLGRLKDLGMRSIASTPAEFRGFLQRERARWESIIRTSGVTIE